MLSPQSDTHSTDLKDCSFEEECLDDIQPELISLTLSSSDVSALSFDEKIPENEKSTLITSCDNISNNSGEESSSDSFLVILSTLSRKDEFSSTETLITRDDIKPLCVKNVSTLEDSDKPETSNKYLSVPSRNFISAGNNSNVKNEIEYPSPAENKTRRIPVSRTKLSSSMYDVSKFPDFPLKQKSKIFSSDVIESQSMTTISTGVKSKDSGIPRSSTADNATECNRLHSSNENLRLDTRTSLSPVIGLYSSSSRLDGKLEPLTSTARSRSHEDSSFTASIQKTHKPKHFREQSVELKTISNGSLSTEAINDAVKYKTQENICNCTVYVDECQSNQKKLDNLNQAPITTELRCNHKAHELQITKLNEYRLVSAWPKILPSLQQAEQNCNKEFEFDCNTNKALNQTTKRFVSPCDRDSGCPRSELCHSSRISVSQKTKHNMEKNLKEIISPVLSMHNKSHFHPTQPPISAIYTVQTNSCPIAQLPTMETKSALDRKKSAGSSQSEVLESPPDIDHINECECWWFDQSPTRSKDSDMSSNTCAQKQEFDVPPLKLGSLLNDSINGDTICNSDTSKLTDGELHSLTSTIIDENITSSQKGTTEDITYPSSTVMTSCDSANMTANDEICSNQTSQSFPITLKKHTLGHKPESYLMERNITDVYHYDYLLPSYTPTSYKSIQPYIENVEKISIVNNQDVKQESLQASSSTSYQSIQPNRKFIEKLISKTTDAATASTAANKNVCINKNIVENLVSALKNEKRLKEVTENTKKDNAYCLKCQENKIASRSQKTLAQLSPTVKQTTDTKENSKTLNLEMSDSSSKHRRRHSGIPNNKIMDVALKILLIHFLNCTEKCNRSGCICNRLMNKKSSSANTQTQTVQVPLKESAEHKKAVGSGSAAVDDECIGASIAINLKNSCVTYKSKTLVNMEREANNERKLDTSSQKSNRG
ncbi:hypothetical protein C0J52_23034 [Blattella germanica]|nr:hypothetical protein C0J52_23034 [Blattella germanica]